jgi:predicted ATPase
MVTDLLGTKDIDSDLEELILEKTEGVPFFIEEFVRSLKEIKIIERVDSQYRLAKDLKAVVIPSTIQDVIMARVDSLPDPAKSVLQVGSVIEREFSYNLIKQVTGLQEKELLSHLSVLKDAELLYERGIYPESTYVFKHALTHELVCDSILARRKKKIHEEIGNAIEELYPDNIRELYGVLADHFIEGGNFEKGAEYSRLASSKARKAASFNEAITYCQNRISCLEKLPRTEGVERQTIDARTTLGLYYHQMTFLAEAKKTIEPIIELAQKLDYKKRLSQVYAIVGTHSFAVEEDHSKAIRHLKTALKLAEEQNDFAALWMANHWIGHAYLENCEFERALYHIKKSLEIVETANIPWSIAITKSCIALNIYDMQGKIDLACQTGQEALYIAEENDDPFSKADVYPQRGITCYFKGLLDESEKYLLRGSAYCKKINYVMMGVLADFYLGELYFDRREYLKSQVHYRKGILSLKNAKGWPSVLNASEIALSKAKLMVNEKDFDLKSLYEYEHRNKMKTLEGWTKRAIGEILLNMDVQHASKAEGWIKKAIETDKMNGMMWSLGRDYALYAELFRRKGNQSKAKEYLGKAVEILGECGSDGWVEKYQKELAALI